MAFGGDGRSQAWHRDLVVQSNSWRQDYMGETLTSTLSRGPLGKIINLSVPQLPLL